MLLQYHLSYTNTMAMLLWLKDSSEAFLIMKNYLTLSVARGRSMHRPHALRKDSTSPTALSSKFQVIPWVPFNLWWFCEYSTFPWKLIPFPGLFLLWYYYSLSPGLKILVSLFFFCTPSPIDSSNAHFLTSPLLQSMSASSSSYHFVY